MIKNSQVVLIGGMPFEIYGRALGPYRIRTVCERANYTASVVDTPWALTPPELSEVLDFVVGNDTAVIGISCTWEPEVGGPVTWLTPGFLFQLKGKYPHAQIVLGVSNTARLNRELVPYADWIVSGFAEDSFPKLLNYVSGLDHEDFKWSSRLIGDYQVKFVNGNTDHIVQDMNSLETIFKQDDMFMPHQPLTIETCRGCVFSCAYCSYPFLGKKSYSYIRSVESMCSEFSRNYKLFGTTRYMIADDTFNDSMEKISRVRQAVEQAGLHKFEFVCYIRPELLHIKPEMVSALVGLGMKGCFFGIESFNNKARKAIGRVTRIEHVLDEIAWLKSVGVRTHGSFIAGLPGDSKEEIESWKERLTSSKNEHFNSWNMNALFLGKNALTQPINFAKGGIQSFENRSLIEKDPAKYGYEIIGEKGTQAVWQNEHMDLYEAERIARDFDVSTASFKTLGGWSTGSAWYHGFSEAQMADPSTKPIDFVKAGFEEAKIRNKYILESIREQTWNK